MYVCLSDANIGNLHIKIAKQNLNKIIQFQVAFHCSSCGFNISWTVHWLT